MSISNVFDVKGGPFAFIPAFFKKFYEEQRWRKMQRLVEIQK